MILFHFLAPAVREFRGPEVELGVLVSVSWRRMQETDLVAYVAGDGDDEEEDHEWE